MNSDLMVSPIKQIERPKIGIVTFAHNTNYGGAIQAYALESFLQTHYPKFDFEIVSYLPQTNKLRLNWKIRRLFSLFCHNKEEVLPDFFQELRAFTNGRKEKKNEVKDTSININNKFISFWGLSKYSSFCDRDSLAKNEKDYVAFIAGSDQIWNPQITFFDRTYFLDFVMEKERKYSYGSSFGMAYIPKICVKEYRKYLECFESLSVRESRGVDIIRNITGMDSNLVVDPVFLLECEEWIRLIKKSDIVESEKFILAYIIGNSMEIEKKAKECSENMGLRLVIIHNDDKSIKKYGPIEWMQLIYKAKVIFTNSFHGCAFSIIFNKSFWVQTDGDLYFANISSRIEELLSKYNLRERTLDIFNGDDEPIDYSEVNCLIKDYRELSYRYIDKMMNSILQVSEKDNRYLI